MENNSFADWNSCTGQPCNPCMFFLILRRLRPALLGQCKVLTAPDCGEIFIVPRLLWHEASSFAVSSDVATDRAYFESFVVRSSVMNIVNCCLFIYVLWRKLHSCRDVTITGKGLHNFERCSALKVFFREGSLSCHMCDSLWTKTNLDYLD